MANSSDRSDKEGSVRSDDASEAGDWDDDDSDSGDDKVVEVDERLETARFKDMARIYGALDANGNYKGFWSDPFCLRDFQLASLKNALPRLCASFLIFFCGLYINNVSQAWLQQKISGYYETNWKPVPPMNHSVILWDVSFAGLPYVPSTKMADMFAGAGPLLVIVRFLVLPGPLSLRWTIFSRVMIIWGMLWCFRGCTIIATPLPNPDYTCKPRISFPDNIWLEALVNTPFVPWYNELTCQDVLYSGHTVAITLSALFFFRYSPVAPCTRVGSYHKLCSISTLVNAAGIACTIMAYYFIVASHFHYTVDVMVGAMSALLFFNCYHHQTRVIWFRRRGAYSRNPIDHFLYWLEFHALDLKAWRSRARKNMLAIDSGTFYD